MNKTAAQKITAADLNYACPANTNKIETLNSGTISKYMFEPASQ